MNFKKRKTDGFVRLLRSDCVWDYCLETATRVLLDRTRAPLLTGPTTLVMASFFWTPLHLPLFLACFHAFYAWPPFPLHRSTGSIRQDFCSPNVVPGQSRAARAFARARRVRGSSSVSEDVRDEVYHLYLGCDLEQLRDKRLVRRVLLGVVVPVRGAVKLDHEAVRHAILPPDRHDPVPWFAPAGRGKLLLTCSPSMLLSFPPTRERTYGFLVVGWMHWSLSASMPSQA